MALPAVGHRPRDPEHGRYGLRRHRSLLPRPELQVSTLRYILYFISTVPVVTTVEMAVGFTCREVSSFPTIYSMYGHINSKCMDQPGKIANPARGQLNREK